MCISITTAFRIQILLCLEIGICLLEESVEFCLHPGSLWEMPSCALSASPIPCPSLQGAPQGRIISPKITRPLSHGDTLGSKGTVNITTDWSGTQFAGPTEGPGRLEKHPGSCWPDHTWCPRACGHTVRHCQEGTQGQRVDAGSSERELSPPWSAWGCPLWGSVVERSSLWSLWPCTTTGHLPCPGPAALALYGEKQEAEPTASLGSISVNWRGHLSKTLNYLSASLQPLGRSEPVR